MNMTFFVQMNSEDYISFHFYKICENVTELELDFMIQIVFFSSI